MRGRAAALFCLIAGGGDAATGFLLVAAPGLVLHLLGIDRPDGDLVFLRFAGVFVGCVGLAYLYPWLWRDGARRNARLTTAIEITTGIRLAVALFLTCAVVSGALEPAWLTVGIYDMAIAILQLVLRARGAFADAV
jgi:hypothetical protein